MRPFRFFFGLSIALILFYFLARVFIAALVIAAVLSGIYYIVQKVKTALWRADDRYDYAPHRQRYFDDSFQEPLVEVRRKMAEPLTDIRYIYVR
ncbi:MAG: hypothetical protein AAFP19_22100 [Bacteroidota bacterium]